MTRITQRAVALTSLQGLNRNLDSIGRLQQQLTSGKAVSKPSDSPTGTNRSMQLRSAEAAIDQHARNITDAKAWLEGTDSSLQTMVERTRRVRDLTLQGVSTGSGSDASRRALAVEVTSIREGMLALANEKVNGRPLFGGITAGVEAYDASGAWVGSDAATVDRQISDAERLPVNISGQAAFGPAGADLFAVVDRISGNMTADPAALATDLDDLDVALDRMLTALADVGARAARLEAAEQVNGDRSLALKGQRAQVEDIDLPRTIMELQMQQVGYETALAATAKVVQPSLMDYLR
jgi:flagellin-like hook-associated protein FlgL